MSSFAEAGVQPPIVLYEDVDHGSTVHRGLRNMRRSFSEQLPIRKLFGVGCLCFWTSKPSMFSQGSWFGEAIRLAEPRLIEDHLCCRALPNLGRSGLYASSFLCFDDHSYQPSPLDMITDLTTMFFFWCALRLPHMERGCSELSEDKLYLLLLVSPLFATYGKGWVLRRRFGIVSI